MRSLQTIPNKRRLVLAACSARACFGFSGYLSSLPFRVSGRIGFWSFRAPVWLLDGWSGAFTDLAQSVSCWCQLSLGLVSPTAKGKHSFYQGPDEGGAFTSSSSFLGADAPFHLANHCRRSWCTSRKEGAPREIGALLATPLGRALDLSFQDRMFLIACGAGAGLAAVYQVPLTSVFFIFETLGLAFSIKTLCLGWDYHLCGCLYGRFGHFRQSPLSSA